MTEAKSAQPQSFLIQRDERSALISPCGTYRYWLHRRWDDRELLYWIMLNPSTADAMKDDPTIRKCIGFAKLNGYGGIAVGNLFAYRATDPRELILCRGFVEPVGPDNDAQIKGIPTDRDVVCAWGLFPYIHPSLHWRTRVVRELLANHRTFCVKRTEDRPWHPLYVKYGELVEYV